MKRASFFRLITRVLLGVSCLVGLVVTNFSIFPFVYGKALFVYGVVDLAALVFLFEIFVSPVSVVSELKTRVAGMNRWLMWSLLAFVASMGLSTVFGVSPSVSLWGMPERNDGLIMYVHLLIFVFLAALILTRRDWRLFVLGLMGTATVFSIVGWIEFLRGRVPMGFLGNPTYLGAFLVSVLGLVALVTSKEEREKYKLLYGAFALLSVSVVILTGIRGEFLGLVGGGVVMLIMILAQSSSQKTKKTAGAIFGALILFGLLFFFTRSASVWKNIPVLSRLGTLSTQSNSYVERIGAWKAGLSAVRERPLLGWGNDNFGMIFEKFGASFETCNEDKWFTSLHNKYLDVAVGQGVLGLVLYLFVLGLVIFLNRKNILFVGLFVAYMIQNFFVFDTVSTLVVFAATLSITLVGAELSDHSHEQKELSECYKVPARALAALGIVVAGLLFFYSAAKPLNQQLAFGKFLKAPNGNALDVLVPVLLKESPASVQLAPRVNAIMREWGLADVPQGRLLLVQSVNALKQVIAKNPEDVRPYEELILTSLLLSKTDPTYALLANEYSQKAILTAPYIKRVQVWSLLTYSPPNENRINEIFSQCPVLGH